MASGDNCTWHIFIYAKTTWGSTALDLHKLCIYLPSWELPMMALLVMVLSFLIWSHQFSNFVIIQLKQVHVTNID